MRQPIRPLYRLVERGRRRPQTEEDLEQVVRPGDEVEEGDGDADEVDGVRPAAQLDVPDDDPAVEEGRQRHDGDARAAPHGRLFRRGELVGPRQQVQAAKDDRSEGPRGAEVDFVFEPVASRLQVRDLALPAAQTGAAAMGAGFSPPLVCELLDGPVVGVCDLGGEAYVLRLREP